MPIERCSKIDCGGKAAADESALWADLSRNADEFESPAWHGDVLRERAKQVESARTKYIDWEEAKRDLRSRLK